MSIVLVADPSEDGAISRDVEREIDAVRKVFKAGGDFTLKIAVGREADEKRILADLPGATVFHVTGHGTAARGRAPHGHQVGERKSPERAIAQGAARTPRPSPS